MSQLAPITAQARRIAQTKSRVAAPHCPHAKKLENKKRSYGKLAGMCYLGARGSMNGVPL